MAGRYDLIVARGLDLWSRRRLNLRLDLSPVRPLRIIPPLHSVGLLLSFRPGLRLDRGLHPVGRLRFVSLLSLLSLRPGLRLNRRLHLDGRLSFLSLLSLLSLGSGLRLDRSLGLSLSGSRLNLGWGFATASALAPFPVRPARLSLILPRIGRPVLVFAAAAIVGLRQCHRRARKQKDNSG